MTGGIPEDCFRSLNDHFDYLPTCEDPRDGRSRPCHPNVQGWIPSTWNWVIHPSDHHTWFYFREATYDVITQPLNVQIRAILCQFCEIQIEDNLMNRFCGCDIRDVMDIECQGCYYTLCSFVCLTEDLSEILQFLWRHGCLRRSYLCEKCGRKCAIGDKDLFFRCNRNTLDVPLNSQVPDLASQGNNSHSVDCQQQQHVQTNGDGQINLHHDISQITHHQYGIPQGSSPEVQQQGRMVSLHGENPDSLMLIDNRLHHGGMIPSENCRGDSINQTIVPDSVLSQNQSDRLLTIIDSQGNRIIHANDQNNLMTGEGHTLPLLQGQPMVHTTPLFPKEDEGLSEEPPQKLLKRKPDSGKTTKKRCNFKVSMKKGTFFEKSKLPIDTVCKFVVFWCCMKHPTQEFLRNELSLATRTVVDWSTACREICIHWAKSVSEKIGGDGVMVQIDEVKIQENKESKQGDSGNRFSFWGMEKDKEKGKIFIVPVPACDSWSLLTVVNDWILPGSVIISNCWKAYDCLKLQEFMQQTAVQSKTFVHPQNNSGQQNFDVKGDDSGSSSGCELQMPRFGTRRSHHLGDLAEFMFKRRYSNHLERMHAFFRQISLAYPLR